jgi:hypothetical protein
VKIKEQKMGSNRVEEKFGHPKLPGFPKLPFKNKKI